MSAQHSPESDAIEVRAAIAVLVAFAEDAEQVAERAVTKEARRFALVYGQKARDWSYDHARIREALTARDARDAAIANLNTRPGEQS